ncbi:MAG: NAD-dependent epimerase/dehydratase family protein [Deltaproteobacteria bacterium]|nr:NAD-dependent epimerase/dehydratase family protein [Deltaproteobacteria bacterium]
MSARRAIVSGGAGFIGSHLVERLLADGHEVVVLDNLATGRLSNLTACGLSARLTIHQVDISAAPALQTYCSGADWIFHLAALADIVPSIERPADYFRANVAGTLAMLEAARAVGAQRFLYAASSSCYGIPTQFPTPETAPIQPQYPYALTKHLGEQLVLHWCQVYHLPVVCLRLFNVYGPRARTHGSYGAVFGTFLAQKLAGKPFTVVGNGTQTRDFTYVDDVVAAFLAAANAACRGAVLNVGSGGTYSVNQLVALLGGDVVHVAKRPGEPDCTFADIRQARETLNWQPSVPFAEGVRRTVAQIEDWHGAPVWDPDSIATATAAWFRQLQS